MKPRQLKFRKINFLLKSEFESFVESDRIEGLMKELYDKRLNILVHGLEETESVWETKEKSKVIFETFLKEGLKIEPHLIHPIDVHRLPQHPVFKNQKKITRPIIVKLADSFEKHLIMKSLKNLKAYNETRCKENHRNQSQVFISDYLPQEFQKHKKLLMPQFKSARKEGKKTYWKAEDAACIAFLLTT